MEDEEPEIQRTLDSLQQPFATRFLWHPSHHKSSSGAIVGPLQQMMNSQQHMPHLLQGLTARKWSWQKKSQECDRSCFHVPAQRHQVRAQIVQILHLFKHHCLKLTLHNVKDSWGISKVVLTNTYG